MVVEKNFLKIYLEGVKIPGQSIKECIRSLSLKEASCMWTTYH